MTRRLHRSGSGSSPSGLTGKVKTQHMVRRENTSHGVVAARPGIGFRRREVVEIVAIAGL